MNRWRWIFCLLFALSCTRVFAGGAQPVTERIPLAIVGTARIDREKLAKSTPLITIGGIAPAADLPAPMIYPPTPTHWQPVPQRGEVAPIIKDLVAGDKKLMQSDSNSDTVIYIVSPEAEFECYQPVALTRKGNLFILELMTGTMDIPRDATPEPSRGVFLVSLGKLEKSDYQLDVRVINLAGNEQTYPLYARKTIDTGSVPFTVRDGNALERASKSAAVLNVTDLKSEADPKAGTLCQLPQSLPLQGQAGQGTAFSASVGACEGYPFTADKPAEGDAPALKAAAAGPLCVLMRGPDLDTGQWMTLRSIDWDGMTAKITVEIWRDQTARKQNIRFSPLLLVPLTQPTQPKNVEKATPLKVMVAFHGMMAREAGQPYVPDADGDIKYVEATIAK